VSFPVKFPGDMARELSFGLGVLQYLDLGEVSMIVSLSDALVCSCPWLDGERSNHSWLDGLGTLFGMNGRVKKLP
jgi:hypothetical protein